jgi:hypothetical protein
VANCAVGSNDKNVWLFDLSSGKPVLTDAENLAVDLSKSQVFDFDAVLANGQSGPIFFSSTEEGVLWEGDVSGGRLIVTGITKSSPEGGSIIAVAPGWRSDSSGYIRNPPIQDEIERRRTSMEQSTTAPAAAHNLLLSVVELTGEHANISINSSIDGCCACCSLRRSSTLRLV